MSENANFVQTETQSTKLQESILDFVQDPCSDISAVSHKLQDWHPIIKDFCFANDLSDIHVENMTQQSLDTCPEVEIRNMYVYSGYLKAGMHNYVIYVPETGKLYVKTMVLDVNTKV
jgi:hypothetical protein